MHFDSYRGAEAAGNAEGQEGRGRTKQTRHAAKPSRRVRQWRFRETASRFRLYNPQTRNAENPTCVIVAIDAKTGKEAWRSGRSTDYTGCTMALKGDKLVYQTTQGVFCLDARTGKQNWAVEKDIPYGRGNSPNSLVLSDDAVYSEEGKSVFAYALADGSDYWGKSITARKGYQASTDLLIAADALWMCGSCNNAKGIVTQKPTATT